MPNKGFAKFAEIIFNQLYCILFFTATIAKPQGVSGHVGRILSKYQIHEVYLSVKKTIVTFLLIIIVGVCYAQTLTQKIANIRTEVQRINNDSGYKIKTLSNEQFLDEMPDGGGELQGYYRNGDLIKIVEIIHQSSCINITEYYLLQSLMHFVK